jgi:hypothetical protein
MPIQLPEVVTRFFELDAVRDVGGIVALFADDATVTDEGERRQGIAAIRDWQRHCRSEMGLHPRRGPDQPARDRALTDWR